MKTTGCLDLADTSAAAETPRARSPLAESPDPNQAGSLVIVFDSDFIRITLLPPEGHAVLIIDANAVAANLIALESLQSIPGRDEQIVESSRHIEHFELPLRHTPNLTRNLSSGARVSLTKQIRGRIIPE